MAPVGKSLESDLSLLTLFVAEDRDARAGACSFSFDACSFGTTAMKTSPSATVTIFLSARTRSSNFAAPFRSVTEPVTQKLLRARNGEYSSVRPLNSPNNSKSEYKLQLANSIESLSLETRLDSTERVKVMGACVALMLASTVARSGKILITLKSSSPCPSARTSNRGVLQQSLPNSNTAFLNPGRFTIPDNWGASRRDCPRKTNGRATSNIRGIILIQVNRASAPPALVCSRFNTSRLSVASLLAGVSGYIRMISS